MNINPKRVIGTGASSGIGQATAVLLTQEGWEVCLVARRQTPLENIRREFPDGHHLVVVGSSDDPHTAERIYEAELTITF